MIITINPATEQRLRVYEPVTKEDVQEAVNKAREAFRKWRTFPPSKRAAYLEAAARTLRNRGEELGRIITEEMGKPIKESVPEVVKCAWALEYYAEHAEEFLRHEPAQTDAKESYVAFEPLGVVASIMPWNFPMWQLVRFAAPALAAGNTTVFKPSSVTPETGLRLDEAFRDAGLPEGCFRALVGDYRLGQMLIEGDTDAVSFTGSVSAGAKVAVAAATRLKKFVLELGGSDPFIVLGDVDVEEVASAAVVGRFINAGQSCIAAKRFFIVKEVAEEFVELFAEKSGKLAVGNPLDEETDVGPMVREGALNDLDRQVQESVKMGANVVIGGRRMKRRGYFYEPTILTDVSLNMPVMKEETFGPVAPVMVVENEEEAIRAANASEYGLGASVWTKDMERGEGIARRISAGLTTVNNVVISDPRVPFGGVKRSGVGRELSRYGLLEFTNIKTVRLYEEPPAATVGAE